MKINSIWAFLMASAAIVGCSRGDLSGDGPVGRELVLEVLSSDGALSRTWMGDVSQGVVPVYWSDGDQVCVNGIVSSPLAVPRGEKISRAAFQVRNVEAPFDVLYPAADAVDFNDGTRQYIVEIPAVQDYVPGTFSNGAAILYGRAAAEGEPVQLKNLCGAVKVTLKDDSAVINSLVLTSLGGRKIAGRFTLDASDGTLSAMEGEGGVAVTLRLPEGGVSLTPEGTSFIITIPQGSYPEGFSLKFVDSARHILRNYWLRSAKDAAAGVEVRAGDIVTFAAAAYDPDAREICSASDWEEFAAAYNAGTWQSEWLCKDGTVRIGDDFSATSLTAIDDFAHTLEAGGHTITQTAGSHPLFKTLSGTVRNLTLDGKMTPSDPSVAGAVAFASKIVSGGMFEGCTNRMSINSTAAAKTVAGAFARTMTGGTLKDCVNDGDIYVNVDINESDKPIVAGGFVGTVADLTSFATITGCTNNAPVKVIATRSASVSRRPLQAGYGGIVGTVVSGDAGKYLTVENCTNNGDISVTYSTTVTAAPGLLSGVGGIAGTVVSYNSSGTTMWWWTASKPASVASEDCVYAVLRGCTNNGRVSNDLVSSCSSDDPYKCFAGGVVGAVNGLADLHAEVIGCRNTGTVVGHEGKYNRSCYCSIAAGLAGMAAYADFTDCVVKSAQTGSSLRPDYSTAGGIGYVVAAFRMTGCRIFSDLVHPRVTNFTDMNYALGFNMSTKAASQGGLYKAFVKIDGSEVTDCGFGGTVTYNSTAASGPDASFKLDKKETLTASNVSKFIASESFYSDAEKLGIPDKVKFEGNTYWDGKE